MSVISLEKNYNDTHRYIGTENIFNGSAIKKYTLWETQNYKTTKMKLAYNCIKQVTEIRREALTNDTYRKLKRLHLINEAIKRKNSPNNSQNIHEAIPFLGVIDVTKCELNDSEKLEIRSLVEAKLREQIYGFIARYNDLGGNLKDIPKNRNNVNSKTCYQNNQLELLNWKKKIDEIYMKYEKHLRMVFELLIDWSECKGKVSEARFKSTERVLLQAQLTETQTAISKLSCHLRIFLESPASINAFRILKSNLDIKVHQLNDDIQRKSNLKKEFEDLKCTEYDEILKKYIDMCNAVKKRTIFFERL